ncbi:MULTISPECIES: hypothetical protein [Rhizobium]|uniref:hypothetical protein n=1 Tax=Rhizobium TaxID=379 RepID=UPI0014411B67|nr:hypothetical protein [Rhizobium leguminosarum]
MTSLSERNKKWASELSDEDLLAEWAEVQANIEDGFGEHGGSPGEWWYEWNRLR